MMIYNRKIRVSSILMPIIILLLTGCGLMDVNEQAGIIDNAGTIKGSVINRSNKKGPLIIVILQKDAEFLKKKTKLRAAEDGSFKITVLPDAYMLAAYVDSNENSKYDPGEAGRFYSDASVVQISEKQVIELSAITIVGPPKVIPNNLKLVSAEKKIVKNIGKVTTLNDSTFRSENYSMGMWKPLDFIEQVGGGLFLLSPYDKSKTPVLFVHGIGGGPTDFSDLIATLDKKRFQPMVLYYPSGLRLNIISDYLSKSVSDLQTKYRFKKMIVVAHSMGGLVSRSFLKKYFERYPKNAEVIQLYITINSPMQGISSLSAIDYYPLVIPVWRDLVPDSPFIQDIHQWRLPKSIKYHMVFSYKQGKDNDGVVSIHSQLPYNLQSESNRLYGFNTNHIGPLHDEKLLAIIKAIIQQDGEKK